MRILAIISLFIITTVTLAGTPIKGAIRKGIISLPYNLMSDKVGFPSQHYDVRDIMIFRTDDPITLKSGMEIEKNTYNVIGNRGSLDLVKYDKSTGYYKYQLTMNATQLYHLGISTSHKPMPIAGKISFNAGMPSIIIEGRVTFVNNQPILDNTNNKSNISLAYGKPENNRLILTALKDIPVILYAE